MTVAGLSQFPFARPLTFGTFRRYRGASLEVHPLTIPFDEINRTLAGLPETPLAPVPGTRFNWALMPETKEVLRSAGDQLRSLTDLGNTPVLPAEVLRSAVPAIRARHQRGLAMLWLADEQLGPAAIRTNTTAEQLRRTRGRPLHQIPGCVPPVMGPGPLPRWAEAQPFSRPLLGQAQRTIADLLELTAASPPWSGRGNKRLREQLRRSAGRFERSGRFLQRRS